MTTTRMQPHYLIVQTMVKALPEGLNGREENKLTLLLSRFSESFSPFMKSGDSATGVMTHQLR